MFFKGSPQVIYMGSKRSVAIALTKISGLQLLQVPGGNSEEAVLYPGWFRAKVMRGKVSELVTCSFPLFYFYNSFLFSKGEVYNILEYGQTALCVPEGVNYVREKLPAGSVIAQSPCRF